MGWGGFLKGLGKIGSVVAAPFTGGASLAALPAIDAAGEMLGGGAAAAKEGRMSEAQLQALITGQNNRSQLDAAQFNAGQEGSLIRRALAARMVGDLKPPTDPRARFGGGDVSPVLKAMLERYGGMADQSVMGGGYKVQPQMAGIPKSGAMEKIGGAAGTAGGILGILGKLKPSKPPVYGPGN